MNEGQFGRAHSNTPGALELRADPSRSFNAQLQARNRGNSKPSGVTQKSTKISFVDYDIRLGAGAQVFEHFPDSEGHFVREPQRIFRATKVAETN